MRTWHLGTYAYCSCTSQSNERTRRLSLWCCDDVSEKDVINGFNVVLWTGTNGYGHLNTIVWTREHLDAAVCTPGPLDALKKKKINIIKDIISYYIICYYVIILTIFNYNIIFRIQMSSQTATSICPKSVVLCGKLLYWWNVRNHTANVNNQSKK